MPIDQAILETIEQLRIDAGISRGKLAESTGMSRTALTKLLNGKTSDIKLSTLKRIAEALDCDVKVILQPKA